MMTDIFIFLFFDVALTDMTFFFSYTASYAFLSTRSFSIVLSVLFLKVFCKKSLGVSFLSSWLFSNRHRGFHGAPEEQGGPS